MSIEIVLQHLRGSAVEGPQRAVRADVEQMDVGRVLAGTPFVKIFAVFIEHLNAMVAAVVHEDAARLRIDGDAVHVVHVARALVVRRRSFLSPIEKEFAVLVEFRDARSVVAVGHKHGAVGKPRQKRRAVEVRAVRAGHFGRADGLHQLFPVVRELIDRVHVIVDYPDMFVRIVGIDRDEVRALQNLVPLRPAFDDVAVGVRDDDAVFPLRIDAERSRSSHRLARRESDPVAAAAGQRRGRRIAPGQPADRELNARTELRQQLCSAAA